jgi:hypothetical protein
MRVQLRIGPLLLGVLCLAGIGMTATASHAEDSAKRATLTINALTQLPGTTVAAGNYVFKQSGEQAGWNIVQVYNQDESSLVTTLLAYPNPTLSSNGQAILIYPQSTDGRTQVMEAFFFENDSVAQQLAYPKKTADEIGAANHVRVPTTGTSDAYPSSLPSASSSWSSPLNQGAAPTSAQNPVQTSSEPPAPNASTAKSQPLPQAASPVPLIGLIGLLAIVGIVVLRRISRAS